MALLPLTFHKTVQGDGFPVANGIYFVLDDGKMKMVVTAIDGSPIPLEAAAAQYVETFAAAGQWTVNHNLGRRPASVAVLSPGGVEVVTNIVHISDNQLVVQLNPPMAGQVIVS